MSTAHRQRRIRKEFENFARGLIAGVKIVERSSVGDLLTEMEGPKESPFEETIISSFVAILKSIPTSHLSSNS